jgi:hypothetical protein
MNNSTKLSVMDAVNGRISHDKHLNVFREIEDELNFAVKKFGDFSSVHEGYAVLKEEIDELWDEIKNKNSTRERMREEAIQVAAMAVKFITFIDSAPTLQENINAMLVNSVATLQEDIIEDISAYC